MTNLATPTAEVLAARTLARAVTGGGWRAGLATEKLFALPREVLVAAEAEAAAEFAGEVLVLRRVLSVVK